MFGIPPVQWFPLAMWLVWRRGLRNAVICSLGQNLVLHNCCLDMGLGDPLASWDVDNVIHIFSLHCPPIHLCVYSSSISVNRSITENKHLALNEVVVQYIFQASKYVSQEKHFVQNRTKGGCALEGYCYNA